MPAKKKKPSTRPNAALKRAAKRYRAVISAKEEPAPGHVFVRLELDETLVKRVNDVLGARGTDLATYVRLQLRAFRSAMSLLSLDDKMPIGKYTGELVEDICRADPSYVEWLAANATSAKFDVDVLDLLSSLSDAAKAAKQARREMREKLNVFTDD